METAGQLTTLLVDPDIEVMDKYAALLQEMGYFAHFQAENGSEALSMINNLRPSMILACQDTPIINGLTLLRLVRKDEEVGAESIFILYGNNISARLLAQAGRSGVDMLIMTPCEPEEFKAKIAQALHPKADENEEQAGTLHQKTIELISECKYDQALETCQDILQISDNAEVYFNMGYIKSMKGLLEEALGYFRKATTINRHHARAYQQMGVIYQKLGQAESATLALEKAGQIHMEQNQDKEAEEIFNTVLTLRPHTTNVYNSLGIIYRRQGRLEESKTAYEKAMKVHPDDEHIYFNAARTYLDLNDMSTAQHTLNMALEINPDFLAAAELLKALTQGLAEKI